MPIFRYRCRKCGARFEALVFGREKPSCEKCGGVDLEKLPTGFSTASAKTPTKCAGCQDAGGDRGCGCHCGCHHHSK